MPLATLALVPSFELTVTFAALDEESNIITRQKVYEMAAATFADAQTARAAFLTDLGVATGALIIGHSMREVYASNDAVASTFNLHRELLITAYPATIGKDKIAHTLPAPALNMVSGKTLNLGHADVTAYINNFIATGGVVRTSDGEFWRDDNPVAKSRTRNVRSGQNY